jgi:hypothetical protein
MGINGLARATRHAALALAVLLAATTAWATPLQASPDGQVLIDEAAGIAWARCVEGMKWDGRHCTGTPQHLTHAQALNAAAQRRQAEGLDWRLPRAAELKRLPKAAPGNALLADAPTELHWSSTTTIDTSAFNPYDYGNIQRGVNMHNANRATFLHGWAVNPATGEAHGDVPKRTRLAVRLVRPLK